MGIEQEMEESHDVDLSSDPAEGLQFKVDPRYNPEDVHIDFMRIPQQSMWQCELFGLGRALVFRPAEGQHPNWFWRQMQYLAFGNKWTKDRTP